MTSTRIPNATQASVPISVKPIVKFDANGGLDWQATHSGGPGEDWAAEDIDLTNDGGAIVAVDNSQFGFLKLNVSQPGEPRGLEWRWPHQWAGSGDHSLESVHPVLTLILMGTVPSGSDLAIVLSYWNTCL